MSEQIAKRLGSNEEELLSALIASMVDAVYAVDDAGVVLFANAAALSILGYGSESELIGRPSHATIHHSYPDGRPFPEADCPLLRPRRTGEAVRIDRLGTCTLYASGETAAHSYDAWGYIPAQYGTEPGDVTLPAATVFHLPGGTIEYDCQGSTTSYATITTTWSHLEITAIQVAAEHG